MQDDYVIRVLGPIDVLGTSGVVAVGGRHARALLGALVIGVGHAVPIDHLREVVWGQDPPESVDNTLQSNVSHLRHVLGSDAIVARQRLVRVDHRALEHRRGPVRNAARGRGSVE